MKTPLPLKLVSALLAALMFSAMLPAQPQPGNEVPPVNEKPSSSYIRFKNFEPLKPQPGSGLPSKVEKPETGYSARIKKLETIIIPPVEFFDADIDFIMEVLAEF